MNPLLQMRFSHERGYQFSKLFDAHWYNRNNSPARSIPLAIRILGLLRSPKSVAVEMQNSGSPNCSEFLRASAQVLAKHLAHIFLRAKTTLFGDVAHWLFASMEEFFGASQFFA